jgi:hypothetical protein
MADVTISATGPREFDVEVRDSATVTSHRVSVPEELIEQLGVDESELERLVRESFAFLLEREPPGAIMGRFSLDVIASYFPEYREELARRLS